MTSKLLDRDGIYICSHCFMRQFQLKEHCLFCGDLFSNWEEIQVDRFKLQEEALRKDESNIYGRNRN